jgi:hypothetical protein
MGIEFHKDSDKFVHHTEPIVKYTGYITLEKDGKEVGKVDATFDFTEIPDEHQQIALQMIMNGARSLSLPSDRKVYEPVIKEENKIEKSIWKRFFG